MDLSYTYYIGICIYAIGNNIVSFKFVFIQFNEKQTRWKQYYSAVFDHF